MKRLLLPLIAIVALSTNVYADYGDDNDRIMIDRFCKSRQKRGLQKYTDCWSQYWKDGFGIYEPREFVYKGKNYKPSRKCAKNEEMRWRKVGLFKGRLEELGCMTEKEHEAYWREYKMRRETRPIMIQNTNVNTNTTIQFR